MHSIEICTHPPAGPLVHAATLTLNFYHMTFDLFVLNLKRSSLSQNALTLKVW